MDVTDVKSLGGVHLGVVMACSGPSGAPPDATVPSDLLVLYPPIRDAVVVYLAREDLPA